MKALSAQKWLTIIFPMTSKKRGATPTCNKLSASLQKDDKSIAAADPMYGNFEKLAKEYLAEERQTCKDLNNQ